MDKKTSLAWANWVFLQTHKIANIAIIANFVFLYICSFLCYLHHVLLVNVN